MEKKVSERRVLLVDGRRLEAWKFIPSPPEADWPATWSETLAYVRAYLKLGKGGMLRKMAFLLMRSLTFSLKPSQASSLKE